jgi:hypothetical protein
VAEPRARKRRKRRWLKRLAITVIALVVLVAAALGVVVLKVRAIVLSALRTQLPNCEVSIGRVTLNPFSHLTLHDLTIVDPAHPGAPSTVTLKRVEARFSLARLPKFDVEIEVLDPELVLRNLQGDPAPFADLYANTGGKASSERFMIRRLDVRGASVAIDEPNLKLSATLRLALTQPPRGDTSGPTRLTLVLDGFEFESGDLKTVPLSPLLDLTVQERPNENARTISGTITIARSDGDSQGKPLLSGTLTGSTGKDGTRIALDLGPCEVETVRGLWRTDAPYSAPLSAEFEALTGTITRLALVASYGAAPGGTLNVEGTLDAKDLAARSDAFHIKTASVGTLAAELFYDAARDRPADRLLVRHATARDAQLGIEEEDVAFNTKLDAELDNWSFGTPEEPTRLRAAMHDLVFAAAQLKTVAISSTLDVGLSRRAGDEALEARGAITFTGPGGRIAGKLDGRFAADGTRVEAEFGQHTAEALLGLWRSDGEHKIPFIHDFEAGITGTVDRVGLVVAYDPASDPGLSLDGEIEAHGLDGTSEYLGLEATGVAVSMPMRIASPAPGQPLAFSVGDPQRAISPGRIAVGRVTWDKLVATDARGTIAMRDYDWTLQDLHGTLYDGRGWGSIEAQPDGTLVFDLDFDNVNLEPLFHTFGREGDELTGRAEGHFAMTYEPIQGIEAIEGKLLTKPPGGIIRFKQKENSFKAVPAGDQVVNALQQRMQSRDYQHFFDKFMNYYYESVSIEAGMSGEKYLLDVRVRDQDRKAPTDLDLRINYEYVRIKHTDTPPQ